MKAEKLKKLIKNIIQEQDFPGDTYDKDISGPCLNKTEITFPSNALNSLQSLGTSWANYVEAQQPEMPMFTVDGQAAATIAELILLNTNLNGGVFLDYYFDVMPQAPEDFEMPPGTAMCPYAYVPWLDIQISCNPAGMGCPDNGILVSMQAQNIQQVITAFCTTTAGQYMCGTEEAWPWSFNQLQQLISTSPMNDGSIGILPVQSVTLQLCNCEWEEFIWGCTDDTAINYDSNATNDDGSCVAQCDTFNVLPDLIQDAVCIQCCNLTDEQIEASFAAGLNPIEGTEVVSIAFDCPCCGGFEDNWREQYCTEGCMDDLAINYDPNVLFDNGTCEYITGCMNPDAFNYNPDAVVSDGNCIAVLEGCMDETALNFEPGANTPTNDICVYIAGCTDSNALNYNPASDSDDGSCFYNMGCMDENALNFDATADFDDGTNCYYVLGCTDPNATNYNIDADQDDLSCCYVGGCMDSDAFNFNPDACTDNGTCIPVINGCMDSFGCNYNENANTDDGSCDYDSCYGCMSQLACNYDETAIYYQPGSCDYTSCAGCMNNLACNFDDSATIEQGNCAYGCYGCTDPNAVNYNPNATNNINEIINQINNNEIDIFITPSMAPCLYDDEIAPDSPDELDPPKDVRPIDYGPGGVDIGSDDTPVGPFTPGVDPTKPEVSPVRPNLTDKPLDDKPGYVRPTGLDKPFRPGDEELIGVERPGCMDETACNYNPNANVSTDTCIYPGDGCELGAEIIFGQIEVYNGVVSNNCECVQPEEPQPDYCNSQSSVCYEDCDQFDCQACFDNYVSLNPLMPTYTFDLSNSINPFVNGPCQGYGVYANNSNQGISTQVDPGEYIPDDGRPNPYNYWHDDQFKGKKTNRNLNEDFIKRFQKLANIKKKKK